jgi:hypothetical protein
MCKHSKRNGPFALSLMQSLNLIISGPWIRALARTSLHSLVKVITGDERSVAGIYQW